MDAAVAKGILKKHWLSISCGGVALLAFVLVFWPLGTMRTSLAREVAVRKKDFDALGTLEKKARKMPALDLDKPTQQELDRFPSDQLIAWVRSKAGELSREAQETLKVAVEMDKEGLIVPNSLPRPGDREKFAFRSQYKHTLLTTLPRLAHSGTPPSEAEIQQARNRLWQDKYKPQILIVNDKPVPESEDQVELAFETEAEELPEKLALERAKQIKVYMDPSVFQAVPDIDPLQIPKPLDIWNAQYRYWVQQKVAKAIGGANESATNVLDAPLKRVLSLNIDGKPVTSTAARDFSVSLTGRVTANGSQYDVFQFDMDVIVALEQIPQFLDGLSRGRFITVTHVGQISSYDPRADQKSGYVYGDQPVARMTLTCELLLFRKWQDPFRPR